MLLPLNPFFDLLEWCGRRCSAQLPDGNDLGRRRAVQPRAVRVAWVFFARARGRIAFWL